jgi:hypothetical protein
MNISKYALAALAAVVFLVVINAVISPLVFPQGPPEVYRYQRDEPRVAFHLLAVLVTAVLMAYIFPIGYRGGKPWAEGLRFGMLMGVLASLPMNLRVYALTDTALPGLLSAVLWTVITWGISGGLIGAVFGSSLRAE